MTAGDRSCTPLDVAAGSRLRSGNGNHGRMTSLSTGSGQNTGYSVYQPPPRIQPHSGVPPQGLVAVRPVACRGGPPMTSTMSRCGVLAGGHVGHRSSRGDLASCDVRLGERYASAPALVIARKCYGSSELSTLNTNTADTFDSLQPNADRSSSSRLCSSSTAAAGLHNSLDRRLFTRNAARLQMHQASRLSGSTSHLWQPQTQTQHHHHHSTSDVMYRDSPPLLTPSPSDSGFASGIENNITTTTSTSSSSGTAGTGSGSGKRDRAPLSNAGRNHFTGNASRNGSLPRRNGSQSEEDNYCSYQSKTVQQLEQCLARAEQEVCALRTRLEEALWEQGRRRGETALMRAQLRDTRNALSARELELLRLRHDIRHNCNNCTSNSTCCAATTGSGAAAEPCAESQRLRSELESKCAEFESERQRWQHEKQQVLRYQRCLLNQLRNKVLPDGDE